MYLDIGILGGKELWAFVDVAEEGIGVDLTNRDPVGGQPTSVVVAHWIWVLSLQDRVGSLLCWLNTRSG